MGAKSHAVNDSSEFFVYSRSWCAYPPSWIGSARPLFLDGKDLVREVLARDANESRGHRIVGLRTVTVSMLFRPRFSGVFGVGRAPRIIRVKRSRLCLRRVS